MDVINITIAVVGLIIGTVFSYIAMKMSNKNADDTEKEELTTNLTASLNIESKIKIAIMESQNAMLEKIRDSTSRMIDDKLILHTKMQEHIDKSITKLEQSIASTGEIYLKELNSIEIKTDTLNKNISRIEEESDKRDDSIEKKIDNLINTLLNKGNNA